MPWHIWFHSYSWWRAQLIAAVEKIDVSHEDDSREMAESIHSGVVAIVPITSKPKIDCCGALANGVLRRLESEVLRRVFHHSGLVDALCLRCVESKCDVSNITVLNIWAGNLWDWRVS